MSTRLKVALAWNSRLDGLSGASLLPVTAQKRSFGLEQSTGWSSGGLVLAGYSSELLAVAPLQSLTARASSGKVGTAAFQTQASGKGFNGCKDSKTWRHSAVPCDVRILASPCKELGHEEDWNQRTP